MTYEEAIRIVKTCMVLDDCFIKEAGDMAIEALEKQIPVAPKEEFIITGIQKSGTEIRMYYYFCPKCGRKINHGSCCANNECGQRIDWSEK